ncbi:MAG: hypothetical protein E7453_05280 [Ruminococcaceae bacterium]|nr:hypothetical protein [Oscillospiraceae bacterium]
MSRKLKYLGVIPLYGAIILWFSLFIKVLKQEVDKKKLSKYFWRCGLLGGFIYIALMLGLVAVSKTVDIKDYISYGILIVVIIGGYLLNLITFKTLNKHWDEFVECQ